MSTSHKIGVATFLRDQFSRLQPPCLLMEDTDTTIGSIGSIGSIDPDHLYHYIHNLLLVLQQDFTINSSHEVLQRFILNHSPDTLFAVKQLTEYTIVNDMSSVELSSPITHATIIIKQKGQIASQVVLSDYLNVLNIPMQVNVTKNAVNESFEKLRYLINLGLAPYFDIISASADTESTSVNLTKKKFNELSLSLQHLQQRIQIPDLLILCHPKIHSIADEDDPALLDDTIFLNELTLCVNNWILQIQSITKLNHSPLDGESIVEEIQFWKSMEVALLSIVQQISSNEIQLSIRILNKAKRFHITLSFQNDIGLNDKLITTKLYNSLLKELPIDELISITGVSSTASSTSELPKIELAIINLFNHLKSKLKNLNSYPLTRSVELIEVLLDDIVSKFKLILTSLSIMSLPIENFLDILESINKIFSLIDQNIKFMVNLIRELLRKRSEKFIIIKINQIGYTNLKERLVHLRTFRLSHESLLTILENFLDNSLSESTILVDAYNKFIIPLNVLDLSNQGKLIWGANEKSYMGVYKQLNLVIISQLNGLFDKCVTFADYLAILSETTSSGNIMLNSNRNSTTDTKSNTLILLINDEYKLRILGIVNFEIENLIDLNLNSTHVVQTIQQFDQFKKLPLGESEFIPSVLYRLSLSSKLTFYLENLEKLLGVNWNKYSLGSKIETELNGLIGTLNPEQFILNWLTSIQLKVNFEGKVVKITDESDIFVNFDYSLIGVLLQLNQIVNLGFKVPVNILIQFKKIEKLYPLIVELIQNITLLKSLFGTQKFEFLVENQKRSILKDITALVGVDWIHLSQALDLQSLEDTTKNESLIEIQSLNVVNTFQRNVYKLYENLSKLAVFDAFLESTYNSLFTSPYQEEKIKESIKTVQTEFNKMVFEDFVNLERLGRTINDEIRKILLRKCELELLRLSRSFVDEIEGDESDGGDDDEGRLEILHNIVFQDQTFTISPTLSSTKQDAFILVNRVLSIVESQVLIKYGSVDESAKPESKVISTENSELPNLILTCLSKIDESVNNAQEFYYKFKLLQSLWELNLDTELTKLIPSSATLPQWLEIVNNIIKLRSIFDTDSRRTFGMIVIDFSKVQSRVNLKFDQFQGELLKKLASILEVDLVKFSKILILTKESLEAKFDFEDSVKLITSIETYLQNKNQMKTWLKECQTLKQAQQLLTKRRFKFEHGWIYTELLENLISVITTLFTRKEKLIEDNFEILSSKIKAESDRLNDSISTMTREWPLKKPVSGMNPSQAIGLLDTFHVKCSVLNSNGISLVNVSKWLNISISIPEDLNSLLEEIHDFKSVWSSINTLWEDLERIKSVVWFDFQPRVLRKQLDDLLSLSRSLPSKVRQYAAFEEIQNVIKSYLKTYSFINDLKNEAMKPRHWKTLFRQLGATVPIEMTVGNVWSLNFALNESTIKAILDQANNEQTIEDNLSTIKKEWTGITFEMFNYDNKCRLVKNWDRLFDQCNSDINTLSSMKNSPYYSNFEQEVNILEERLNRLFVVLDTWIDVQRQWVYLDGVFGNKNNDIKNLLPIESSRFSNISYEFFSVVKRIYKYSLAIDILLVNDIQLIMDKFLDLLVKVRKSLTDYLEKQRELFARFYFVGNEDLLEIIGSSVDIQRINRHFKKMFSGISSVDFEKESSTIVAINSEQGEKVRLRGSVSLIKFPRLNEWLRELELEVKLTLARLVEQNIPKFKNLLDTSKVDNAILEWKEILGLPAQVSTVVLQIVFTNVVESNPPDIVQKYSAAIKCLSTLIGSDIPTVQRKKAEYLLIELLHQRDLISSPETSWNLQQLFYFDSQKDILSSVTIKQANAEFTYGYEYIGIPEKLAYTPLIDRCFLTMTQALDQKLGGSPFGPAGTGKTESIKALGNNLGKMVLVFCCDDSFDFQSMGRIFLGLCKVGSWGCFDEFNRLDEKILSAVSSQIESIESHQGQAIEIGGKSFLVHPETGIFVTMNPGYAGRFELPENLKKLFRGFSMEKPDREIIVEVLLTSHTFEHARELASVIVPLFLEIADLSSKQSHYDFGLRALKNTLIRCGLIKRAMPHSEVDSKLQELKYVLQSIRETIAPKLILQDELILDDLQLKYFPGITYDSNNYGEFIFQLEKYADQNGLHASDKWITKSLQLHQIQSTHHGLMLVGDSGSGKSTIWKLVLSVGAALEKEDHISYVLDCKVLSKEEIYGSLDSVTRDWTDGLFTLILRKIRANLRGELSKKIWIVFDGDIDPEWAENLNSVLDDNKILTLPNGERLALPENIRLIFEVDTLKFTTLATVSRCGMIWFDDSLVPLQGLISDFLHDLGKIELGEENSKEVQHIQEGLLHSAQAFLTEDIFEVAIQNSKLIEHIMDFTIQRTLSTFATLLKGYCRKFITYKIENPGVPIDDLSKYTGKAVLLSLIWAFAGDCPLNQRTKFGGEIAQLEVFSRFASQEDLLSFDINLPECDWENWRVETIDLEPKDVLSPNTVVPTLDTTRHESLIYSILNEHKSLLLCGPPGSGKTMTLLEALRKSPLLDVLPLNFSKETSPSSLMRSLEQHCEYKKTNTGTTLTPKVSGKWVVVFCDEINLPGVDKYGTQRVISLIRQMIEHNGFWRVKDKQWISLSNIQFVGACNSPNDPGRNKLSDRFLRHVLLIMVDYPGKSSLGQIYQTFNQAMMKCAPDLRGHTSAVTESMLEVYLRTSEHLTGLQDHYIYSPRELTRWTRGVLEGLRAAEYSDLLSFVRLWYHEGLRLFYDRLVNEEDRFWTKDLFKEVSLKYFHNTDLTFALKEPVLYSNWLSLNYESVDEEQLRLFVSERLRVFSEEEIEVDLILHADLLDHALRIDRVLRQKQGHMILAGISTSGKTTLSKFVAWVNGLKVIQLSVTRNYGIENFDTTLREILILCAKGERICFIIDESSIMETSFIERMNTLLANAEIPGLFEGDDYNALMTLCLEQSNNQGLLLDTPEELYSWFTRQISENLHVIFNISGKDTVISSPALFNRCVLSWMGDWLDESLFDIGSIIVGDMPFDMSSYKIPDFADSRITQFRDVVVDAMIYFHRCPVGAQAVASPGGADTNGHPPSSYLNLIKIFTSIFNDKLFELEENQRHISTGLDKLRETVIQVNELKLELSKKQSFLVTKDKQAKVMLNKMLTEQNEAERKQEFSVETQLELEKQEIEINSRRDKVIKDLDKAEPAVLEAQRGVQNIKKQHLTEIRSMTNPPAAVKMTMESVCIMLGYEVSTWRDVQVVVRRDDFISNIVSFNNEEQLTVQIREYMQKVYLAREEFNYEAVYRASKACGPLLQWVVAHLTYSRILQNIGPLRDEVYKLENQTKKTKAQLIAIQQMISELEDSIDKYKEDYSSLIRDAENIKLEMKLVEKKVSRSLKLIDNLTSERERWKVSIRKFGDQRERLIGNSLLSAAFLVYSGGSDQKGREVLMKLWREKLASSRITHEDQLQVSNYLVDVNELLNWEHSGLSNDELNVENFIIMKYSSTPVIVDPSSSILNVLSQFHKKITITSFLNEGFVKQLENSLRFGGVFVIQDAEYYDPIMDSILRHEIRRNGGRMMIKVGDLEVDFSPDFKLIFSTRDSAIKLSPFVSARTTLVNFTITSASLENKILNLTLQDIKPDVEKKRTELVTLQGEYQVRLHSLEEELLSLLSVGNILDNDIIINTLESLKAEATEIDQKIIESKEVMETVEEVRNTYSEVAKHSSLIYKLFKRLNSLNRFYNFSLETFVNIFLKVLKVGRATTIQVFVKELYVESFATIAPSLKYHDRIIFAICLVLSFYSLEVGQHFHESLSLLLTKILSGEIKNAVTVLDVKGVYDAAYVRYDKNDSFEELLTKNTDNETFKLLLPLIRSLGHKDEFMNAFIQLTSFLFSGIGAYTSKYELLDWTKNNTTILLASADGYDATFKVERLAQDCAEKLTIVSMGSKEGVEIANKELSIAATNASWILIQNIQMSPHWLNYLERKLESISPTSKIKIFLTCNVTSNIPAALINKSKVLVYENQPGLRNLVHELFSSIPQDIFEDYPGELKHVCFLLVWYHSIIQERLRYAPISFVKKYDLNDSDFTAGLQVVSKIFKPFMGKSNISPELIPWRELRYLIGTITYGGKIDQKEDLDYIVDLAETLFRVESFDRGFNLIENGLTRRDGSNLEFPEGVSIESYKVWIRELPEQVSLTWIGLEEEVDVLLREVQGREISAEVISEV